MEEQVVATYIGVSVRLKNKQKDFKNIKGLDKYKLDSNLAQGATYIIKRRDEK